MQPLRQATLACLAWALGGCVTLRALAVADLDGDGADDLIVSNALRAAGARHRP